MLRVDWLTYGVRHGEFLFLWLILLKLKASWSEESSEADVRDRASR